MPQVIPAIVAWAGSTAFTVAGVAVTYGTLVEAAIIAGSIAYSSAENRRLRNQLNSLSADRGRDLMTRDPLAYRRLIYGQVRTTGPILYMATEGVKNENLHLVIALASHECDDLGEITIDNDEIISLDGSGNATGRLAGYLTVKKFLGTTTQAASPELIAAFPGIWTSAHNLYGIAYLHVKVKYSVDLFPNGMPTIKCLVRGKKVWDPRLNPSDTTIRAWSCNSTLCTADFLNDSDFGRGVSWSRINTASIIEGANICDESIGTAGSFTRHCVVDTGVRHLGMFTQLDSELDGIVIGERVTGTGIPSGSIVVATHPADAGNPGVFFTIDKDPTATSADVVLTFGASERRYETHGTVTSDQLVDSVILDLASSMAGHVTDMGGIWTIRAGAYRTPTVDLNESHMIGPISMVPRTSRRDNYNGVKGTYISPFNQWVASDAPAVKNDTYMAWDGGVRLWKDVTLPFTTSPSAAQRLFKIDLERGRQQIQVEQTFKLHAFECMCFDTVRLTKTELGWSNKLFEVTNWKFTVIMDAGQAGLGVTLSLRETAAAVWDWADGSETVVDLAENTTLPNPSVVPTPTGLTLLTDSSTSVIGTDGTFIPRMKVTWNLSGNQYIEQGGRTAIEYKKHADSVWIEWIRTRGDKQLEYITDIAVGVAYDVRIYYINQIGVRSNNAGVLTYNTVSNYTIAGDTAAPATPTGLAANPGTGKLVRLTWTANTELDLLGYKIYRNTVNTLGSATLIAFIAATFAVDTNVTLGQQYFYWLSAVDDTNNESAKTSSVNATPTGIATGGTVTSPTASTKTSEGNYTASDGSVYAYMQFTIKAMPAGAVGQDFYMKKSSDSTYILMGTYYNSSDLTGVRIPDLSPGVAYDFAVQAWNSFGDVSSLVAVTGTPFTAASSPAAPPDPTGANAYGGVYAFGTTNENISPIFTSSGVRRFVTRARWSESAASNPLSFGGYIYPSDFDHWEFKGTATNSSSATDYNVDDGRGIAGIIKTKDTAINLACDAAVHTYLWQRAVNTTGITSAWISRSDITVGAWIQPGGDSVEKNVGTSAGTVAAGNDSRITGAAQKASNLSDLASAATALGNLGGAAKSANLSDLASAATARSNLKIWMQTYVPSALAGGSPTESVNIDITSAGCSSTVAIALVDCVSDTSLWAVHDFNSGSNSSTNLVVLVGSRDGTNIGAGLRRYSVMMLIP